MIGRALRGAGVARLVIVVAVACVALSSCTSTAPARHYRYVIPEGTSVRISSGDAPEIFPAKLVVHVGDSLTIVNDDTGDLNVGPYFAGAKSTVTQNFLSPGVLEGACELTDNGSMTIRVLPRG